ncbi:glycosyltransferase [Rhizobium sp. NTR19]|uniref:Glycosyltransferase n=1 Tax=Neorhizobium turbinariae TaxID=2937795 RepID=A0ABT0IUI8_9HYPH|nr:glycosyltransferase [Neorhizobium turbinariae]MCK8781505.1 glycosyltransferase [Neorhizobium turbinariae]
MNVLNIIATVDPKSGGPIEGLRLSAEKMGDWGHRSEIVSLDDPSERFLGEVSLPVHACGGHGRRGFPFQLTDRIRRNAHRFDVAVIHGLWNWASLGGWLALRQAGLPYVQIVHGMMDPWFGHAYPAKQLAKQVVWTLAQGRALRDARAVLFTTEEERRLASGTFSGYRYCEEVVRYGIAEPPPSSEAQLCAFQAAVPRLNSRPYLLFLSRIHEKKGCDLLIEAFARIAGHAPDLQVVLAGPDQSGLRPRLQAQADRLGVGSRLHWTGMLQGDAKWGAFRGADAFILPSHQENFGIAVAEALVCAVPVLITDKVNIWPQVKASGGGLVEVDTVDGVSRLLEQWLQLQGDRKQGMRVAARRCYEKHFQIDAAAQSLLDVLHRAVGRG